MYRNPRSDSVFSYVGGERKQSPERFSALLTGLGVIVGLLGVRIRHSCCRL
jgi:hypothetical protein